MCSQNTQCPHALVEVEPKMTKFKLRKKSDKINLRITANRYAHLQPLTITPATFQNDQAELVGSRSCIHKIPGVYAFVEVEPNMTKFKLRKKRQK